MVDCSSLPERLRQICDGTAVKADGSRFTLHQRRVIVAKRFGIAIAAVRLDDDTEAAGEKSRIGTRLKNMISEYQGAEISCADCKKEIIKLNLMTASEVRTSAAEIAAGIVARGSRLAAKWYQRFAAKHAPSLVSTYVMEWIEKACVDEESGIAVDNEL